MTKPKVAVIFPKYNINDDSHFPYWYKVFEKSSRDLDIFLLFETGQKLNSDKSFTQRIQQKPFNLIERFGVILWLRLKGYSNFYIHYSLHSLFLAKLVTIVFGGKTYLWDCEYYAETPKNKLLNTGIKLTDVLVTGHEKIGKQYKKVLNLGNKQIKVVSSWVDGQVSSLKSQVSSKKKKSVQNILFVHHLSPRKGTRELPEIITKMLDVRKDIVFTIVGDGPDFNYLNNWITENNLENYVKMKGSLSLSKVEEEFKKSDVFIMPSLSEGFPRVILEAQKYGVPYVATDVGCVKEISPLSEKKYIVPVKDSIIFSQKIIELLDIKNKREEIIKDLKNKTSQFSLEKATDEFVNLF